MLREQLTWYMLLRADFTDSRRAWLRRSGRSSTASSPARTAGAASPPAVDARLRPARAGHHAARRRAPTSRSTADVGTDCPVDVLEADQRLDDAAASAQTARDRRPARRQVHRHHLGLRRLRLLLGRRVPDPHRLLRRQDGGARRALRVAGLLHRPRHVDRRAQVRDRLHPAVQDQIQEKIGALLAGDYTSLAPYFAIAGTPGSNNPGWALRTGRTLGERAARPTSSIRRAASPSSSTPASTACRRFPTTFDQSFIDTTQASSWWATARRRCRIPALDRGRHVGPHANPAQLRRQRRRGKEWFILTDPDVGKTYAAQSVAEGRPTARARRRTATTPAVRMLETARRCSDAGRTAACAAPT